MAYTLEQINDLIAIRELSVAYNRCSDAGDGTNLALLFTEDGVWDVAADRVFRGRQEIVERCQGVVIRHITVDPAIELHGDTAGQTSRLVMTSCSPDGRSGDFVATGMYIDDLVRTPQGWRFRTRRVELDFQLDEIERRFAPMLAALGLPSSRLGAVGPPESKSEHS